MRFSNITYCTGINISMKLQKRCAECARQRPMVVDSEIVALWITDKPPLAIDCDKFKAKEPK